MPARKKTVTLGLLYEKLTTIEKRLDNHDKQFGTIATHVLDLKKSFETEILELSKRMTFLGNILERLTGDVETLTQEYRMITVGLKRIEQTIGDMPGVTRASVRSEIDALDGRVTILENKVLATEGN